MTMAGTYIARVRNGRLVLDEPTDLPEGAELELGPVASEKATPVQIRTPRLVDADEAADFELDVSVGPRRAGV
jgi:hypothetical protein